MRVYNLEEEKMGEGLLECWGKELTEYPWNNSLGPILQT
jgi:hypothetical protein